MFRLTANVDLIPPIIIREETSDFYGSAEIFAAEIFYVTVGSVHPLWTLVNFWIDGLAVHHAYPTGINTQKLSFSDGCNYFLKLFSSATPYKVAFVLYASQLFSDFVDNMRWIFDLALDHPEQVFFFVLDFEDTVIVSSNPPFEATLVFLVTIFCVQILVLIIIRSKLYP